MAYNPEEEKSTTLPDMSTLIKILEYLKTNHEELKNIALNDIFTGNGTAKIDKIFKITNTEQIQAAAAGIGNQLKKSQTKNEQMKSDFDKDKVTQKRTANTQQKPEAQSL